MVNGDYPQVMKDIVKDRLPTFIEAEKALVKGSFDYIGLNFYTGRYAQGKPVAPNAPPESFVADRHITETGKLQSL